MGDINLLERLSNLQFLLTETELWSHVPLSLRNRLQAEYGRSLRAIEVDLNLRQPPPDQDKAQALHMQLAQQEAFLGMSAIWEQRKWITPTLRQRLVEKTRRILADTHERLIDAPPIPPVPLIKQQLENKRFLLATLEQLFADGEITAVA
ncbi:MAG: hypothetical protein GY803_16535, partial [Chloroflexi bacterium]|nr:hypothetical protein [Chloroflexota bacterium]